MAQSHFTFSTHLSEPIDSSQLVTRLFRSSFDDLHRQAASSSVSLMGVYVRSPATSPTSSQECLNMIFHPEDNHTEFLIPPPKTADWSSHPATSFASFLGMQNSAPPTSSSAPTHSCPETVENRVNWQYQGLPPEYTLESYDDDEILYMKDVRRTREITRRIAELEPQRPTTAPSPSVSTPNDNRNHSTVAFSPVQPVRRPTRTMRRTRRVADLKEATSSERLSTAAAINNTATATVALAQEDYSVTCDSDNNDDVFVEAAPLPKKGLSVYKVIMRKFRFGTTHRKAVSADDTISIKAVEVPSAATEMEKVKSSSASLFNVHPTTRPPSVQSLQPSVASTKSRKKVLVKKSKTLSSKATLRRATETALLTSSERAIENKFMRRRSASFSGFADVVRPESWKLPEDLDAELVREAMVLVSKKSADDWVYKK